MSTLMCCVCQKEATGAHYCMMCQKPVHAICGKLENSEQEGYGSQVICNICSGCNYEPPTKKTETWCIKYSTSTQNLKHKAPKAKPQSQQSEWNTHCICLTCFESNVDPKVYVMSRHDKSTKERHVLRRHEGKTFSQIDIQNFDKQGEKMSQARQKYYSSCQTNSKATKMTQSELNIGQPLQKFSSNAPISMKSTQNVIGDSSKNTSKKVIELRNDVTNSGNNEVQFVASIKEDIAVLNSKIDDVTKAIKEMTVINKSVPAKNNNTFETVVGTQTTDLPDWKNITNIVELTRAIPTICFYAGDENRNCPSVIRCETCSKLLAYRFSGVRERDDPRKIALSCVSKYSGSLSSGLLLSSAKSENVLAGGNSCWYGIKNAIKKHIACDGEHGQFHFEALQHKSVINKRVARGVRVTQNLIRIALSVLKSKSAAQHFESEIAAHVATGSDLGDFGHSRNHFNEIMATMNVWLDKKTAAYLSKPLVSTRFPPHFYVSADKSTPKRISNQAVMICPMVDGKRVAIPVNSPEVYSAEKEDATFNITGGCADELAHQVIETIKEAYGEAENFNLKAAWQGTSCDGQYQANEFLNTLHRELDVPIDPIFSKIIWDPSHWINLGILDVKEDKVGSSGEFLNRLVSRSKNIHSMFNRGKMLSSVIILARREKLKLKMTRGNCATRFWASQYHEFLTIYESYEAYIMAFQEYGYNEVKEYEILGVDFVVEMCCVLDVMKIVIDMMVNVQHLSNPCWKICIWWPRVKTCLESLKEIDIFEPPECMSILSKHIALIVQEKIFKGQKLVNGWKLVSHDETMDYWVARELQDCEIEIRNFVTDIVQSLQARFEKCVPEMCHHLTCIDFESLVKLLCGERRNGKVVINEGDLEEFGEAGFKTFLAYVCQQEHIKLAIAEGELDLNPRLSNVLHRKLKQILKDIIWEKKEIMTQWFWVMSKDKLSQFSEMDVLGKLESLSILPQTNEELVTVFIATFTYNQGNQKEYQLQLNEEAVYASLYNDENVYTGFGKEVCLVYDIALAKGGPESIVESYYFVMKCHQKSGPQNNNTLSLRTKLDWCLPSVPNADKMVEEVSTLYLNGDKKNGLKPHMVPVLGDKCVHKRSKVLDRIKDADSKLTYLL